MDLFDLVFPAAKAQDLDELAVPTIPFDPPGGTVTPTPTVDVGPSIRLKSDKNSIRVGETTTIEVIIDTDNEEIQEFSFEITFNPLFIEIVDADPNTLGTQINFLDTFFEVTENQVDVQNGTINLTGSTDLGATTITNRTVAEFQIRGKAVGSSQLQLVQAESILLDVNSTDILSTTNNVSITVQSSQVTTTTTPTPSFLPTKLPDNALIDDIGGAPSILFGLLFVALGIILAKQTRNGKKTDI